MALDPKPALGAGGDNLAEWATNGGATVSEPALGKRQIGWIAEIPDHQRQNWLHWTVWQWLKRLTKAWFFRDVDPVSGQKLIASYDEPQNGAQDDGADQNVAGASWVHGSDSMEDRHTAGTPTRGIARTFFDKSKASFRAGTATGSQWDSVNRAESSAAFGENCKAVGKRSFAAGVNCIAGDVANIDDAIIGSAAIAMGASCTANEAGAVALGGSCIATEEDAFAAGQGCTSAALAAICVGQNNTINGSGVAGFIAGKDSTINGLAAFALGSGNIVTADGAGALGTLCTALGEASLVTGYQGEDHLVARRNVFGYGKVSSTQFQRWEQGFGGWVQDGFGTQDTDILLEDNRAYSLLIYVLAHRQSGGVINTAVKRVNIACRVDAGGTVSSDGAAVWVLEDGVWPLAAGPTITFNPLANDRKVRISVSQAGAGEVVTIGMRVEAIERGLAP